MMIAPRKVALITGGTSGIGAETAIGIARTGAHVIVVGRDQAKAAQVLMRIENEAPTGSGGFLSADISTHGGMYFVYS